MNFLKKKKIVTGKMIFMICLLNKKFEIELNYDLVKMKIHRYDSLKINKTVQIF